MAKMARDAHCKKQTRARDAHCREQMRVRDAHCRKQIRAKNGANAQCTKVLVAKAAIASSQSQLSIFKLFNELDDSMNLMSRRELQYTIVQLGFQVFNLCYQAMMITKGGGSPSHIYSWYRQMRSHT